MTDASWRPAVGSWVAVAPRSIGHAQAPSGFTAGLYTGVEFLPDGLLCSVTSVQHDARMPYARLKSCGRALSVCLADLRPATPEEISKVGLASLEGL